MHAGYFHSHDWLSNESIQNKQFYIAIVSLGQPHTRMHNKIMVCGTPCTYGTCEEETADFSSCAWIIVSFVLNYSSLLNNIHFSY